MSISVADTLIFPDEYADLQTAMDFAAVGDSILVKAGTFSIADIEVKSGVTIFGESGNPQDVVLISDSGTHFFSMINADSTTTISNITFMVESYSISLQFSDPTFQNCIFTRGPAGAGLAFVIEGSSPVFEQCRAHSFEYGLFRIKRSSMLFDNCSFYDNDLAMETIGQAPIANIEDSNAEFIECRLENNYGWPPSSGGIYAENCNLIFDSCIVQDNTGSSYGALRLIDSPTSITNCVFENNQALGYMSWGGSAGNGGAIASNGNLHIEYTTFLNNKVFNNEFNESFGTGASVLSGLNTVVSHCIFYGNSAHFGSAGVGPINYDHCIMAFGYGGEPVGGSNLGPVTLTCCDIWGNESYNWSPHIIDQLGVDGNFCGDPAFCDAEAGIFTVCADSPCLPGILPGGCDEIVGIYGGGCDECDPLPVVLTEFSAKIVSGIVQLIWRVDEDFPEAGFRLTRVVGESEIPISFTCRGPGYFEAKDDFDHQGNRQSISYHLYFKDESGVWLLLGQEEVILGPAEAGRQLQTVYPNPFNPTTSIALKLNREQTISLSVFDLQGHLICVLHDGYLNKGPHRFDWNGKNTYEKSVASGTYFIRFATEEIVETQAILLVR